MINVQVRVGLNSEYGPNTEYTVSSYKTVFTVFVLFISCIVKNCNYLIFGDNSLRIQVLKMDQIPNTNSTI